MKNGFDGVNLEGRERSDLVDDTWIAQLESEVLALRANSAIQEQIIEDGGNPFLKDKLVRLTLENTMLKSRNAEAMELLDIATDTIKTHGICGECIHYTPNHMEGLCADCFNDYAHSPCQREYLSNHWTWKHADRYEALKAQSGASGSGADGRE